ncbi:RNA 2',3'-cyclic phosphodiesterase [Desulfobacula sp.]|uniref:RNA 2',3'-cyclic phosphodiesterase n=1 Tax=Desulfobacula sp. TaxID=2593537 RepID=UPI00262A8F11|nr:RNA 2',3'-cyclic phosphodiesterase [Desulfobacula sp.]
MKNDTPHIRSFIAISLPNRINKWLQDLQTQLKKSGIKASWQRPATMHLTITFLGNVRLREIERIKNAMTQAVEGIPIHTMYASGIGVFPSIKNARVIWSGTKGQTDVLEKLATRLEDTLTRDLGFKREPGKFFPHLTLARIKKPVCAKTMARLLQAFKNIRSDDFSISEITLYQSKLTSSGAVHKFLFSAPFKR